MYTKLASKITLTLIVIALLSSNLNSQEKNPVKDNSVWSLSVNGGVSILWPYPQYNDNLGGLISYNTSFERLELKLSCRFLKHHALAINFGKDKFKREYNEYDYSDPANPRWIGTARIDIREQWLGLDYSYYFAITKDAEYYAEAGYGMNDSYDFMNIRVGMAREITKNLSFDVRLRYTKLYQEMFQKGKSSQIGFDYGLVFKF
ncbi:MAG TPA: hypothetical protein VJ455_02855 [Ignavibacteria bacterium]|nr:hypothetical protein [Ignavibacteria bacterium]